MNKKISTRILLFIFLFIMFVPTVSFFFVKDYLPSQNGENRNLAKKPTLSFRGIADYPKKFDDYYSDNLPYRSELVRLWRDLNYSFFNESVDDRVVLGKNEKDEPWLFYDNINDGDELSYINGKKVFTEEDLAAASEQMREQTEKCRNNNIGLYYILLPNKSTVYSEYLPKSIVTKEDAFIPAYNYLKEHGADNLYYPLTLMKNAKSSGELYYRTDTHWNQLGAYVVADSVMQSIYGKELFGEVKITNSFSEVSGDLHSFMGISEPMKDNCITVDYGNTSKIIEDSLKVGDGKLSVYHNPEYKIDETALLVGDSFSINAVLPFTSVYKKVVHVPLNTTAYNTDMLKRFKPTKVFVVGVERYSMLRLTQTIA